MSIFENLPILSFVVSVTYIRRFAQEINRYIAAIVANHDIDSGSSDEGWIDRPIQQDGPINANTTDAALERVILGQFVLIYGLGHEVQSQVVLQIMSTWHKELVALSRRINEEERLQRQRDVNQWLQSNQPNCQQIE